MLYLKKFNESYSEIDALCKIYLKDRFKLNYKNEYEKLSCKEYTINPDGTVDVDGSVFLVNQPNSDRLTEIPIKFGRVTGDFSASYQKLGNLNNSPRFVGGDFSCIASNLTSLEGAPDEVQGIFNCSMNNSLYDPSALRDIKYNKVQFGGCYFYKIYENLFGPKFGNTQGPINFLQSLDYPYIRGRQIDSRLFTQMCREYELLSENEDLKNINPENPCDFGAVMIAYEFV